MDFLHSSIGKDASTFLTRMSQEEAKKNATETSADAHIMISYQWDSSEHVHKIKENLIDRGFKIFIDTMSTTETGMDAMAKAVEDASVVLVCVSQKYKESRNCKTEAVYANELERKIIPLIVEKDYKPDGWLRAVLAGKVYIDFTNEKKFDAAMEELVNKLENKGVQPVKRVKEHENKSVQPVKRALVNSKESSRYQNPPNNSRFISNKPVEQWSNVEVQEWLKQNGIKAMSQEEMYKTATETSADAHIMISYQWDSSELVHKIKENLIAHGFKIWIDRMNMTGTILDATAKAVEDASVVLVCVSQKYKESRSCQIEALYADQLDQKIIPLLVEKDYKPNRWLGAVLAGKLYMDFTNEKKFDEAIKELVNELENKGVQPVKRVKVNSKESSRYQNPPNNSRFISNKPVEQWSNVEVQEWLKQNGIKATLPKLDGPTLKSLPVIRKESKEVFSKYVYEELGLKNPVEMVKFSSLVEELL